MTIALAAPVVPRVISVLQDYLPAALTAIDTLLADGMSTPEVPNGNYYHHEALIVKSLPSIRLRTVGSDIVEALTTGMGKRVDANHRIDVLIDMTLRSADDNRLSLEKLARRYAAGVFYILMIAHDGLDTVADPVRWCETTTSAGPVSYGIESNQEDGTRTRTAAVPIYVRRREAG